MKILALGDVVGRRTLSYLKQTLRAQCTAHGIDLVIANGENVADIKGLSPSDAEELLSLGVDLITTGNHVFDRRDIYGYLDECPHILRPLNYPGNAPGEGARVVTVAEGYRMLLVNVSGCAFMDALDNPFLSVERALERERGRYDFAVVDIHAEATSEKLAFARFFDGRFAAIFGTHTHVPTADPQVLPAGTGYITDLGMCGPTGGILGTSAAEVIARFRTHLPQRFSVAEGPIRAHGAIFDIDPATGRCRSVERIEF